MLESLRLFPILIVPFLLAITFHEYAHGWVADRLGDPTARLSGRLSLNPIKHLDLVGTLVLFITRMIGWAKPVPINPFNFRNPRRDMMWVALAGPLTNLALAAISAMVYRILVNLTGSPAFSLASNLFTPLLLMVRFNVIVNVGLAVFNVIPVPPLDGSRVVEGLLPRGPAEAYSRLEPYGFLILLGLIFLGAVDRAVFPVVAAALRIFLGPTL